MFKQEFEAVGRCGADPEVRFTPQGNPVATVRVAINDGYMKDETWVDRTIWAKLTFWGKSAEAVGEKAHKGDAILFKAAISGYDEATGGPKVYTKKDGGQGASYEFRVNEWQVFPKGPKADAVAGADPAAEAQDAEGEVVLF